MVLSVGPPSTDTGVSTPDSLPEWSRHWCREEEVWKMPSLGTDAGSTRFHSRVVPRYPQRFCRARWPQSDWLRRQGACFLGREAWAEIKGGSQEEGLVLGAECLTASRQLWVDLEGEGRWGQMMLPAGEQMRSGFFKKLLHHLSLEY